MYYEDTLLCKVINSLSTDPFVKNLRAIDKLILCLLAEHYDQLCTFPLQCELAKILNISLRYMIERITFLKSQGIISVTKIDNKNHYSMMFLSE